MKRSWVPALPALLSLLLSGTTVGPHPYWQDSGFFLAAVKDWGVLYPTGFALYIVLCKVWTSIVFFVDFTLAVHLFSSLCAALAAGTLATAARELLESRGSLFRTTLAEPGPAVNLAACATGCLAAAGYTFWSSAILAKVYAFYFLVLSLLLWRMIRADATGRPRDFMIVAALIGLAWQAHPSAINLGPAILLYVAASRSVLGRAGIVRGLAVAAACALGPLLLLPLFAARDPAMMFGDPRSPGAFWEYVTGSRFTTVPGVFGFTASRLESVGRFGWEEFLGIGLAAVVAGLVRIGRVNRRLLAGLSAWVLPVLLVSVLFKMEGQQDFWFVAAWLPLWLAAAVGLLTAASRAKAVIPIAALLGVVWAVAANHRDLNVRTYDLPEKLGRLYLESLDPGAVLVLRSDNPLSAVEYLQQVRGVRTDVTVLAEHRLGAAWYEERLRKRHPFLQPASGLKSFLSANALMPDHPLFFEIGPSADQVPPGAVLVPAGVLSKVVPRDQASIRPEYWNPPIEPEEVAKVVRRERAQFNEHFPTGMRVRPESNEHRFLRDLLRARKNFADAVARTGTVEAFRRSAEIYETLLALDPWMREEAGAVYPLAGAYYGMKRYDLAEPWLKRALELPELPPTARAQACAFLSAIYRDWKRPEEAELWRQKAGTP
jgi:tetratricopeptide (TPR) repeat protein